MLKFFKEYIKSPGKIGAVAPSSTYLAEKMVEKIPFQNCNCIVEYGPGTGVFTEKILARKKQDTKFIVIEQNKEFYNSLVERYGHKENVVFVCGSAEKVQDYLQQNGYSNADYIISGLPFTSLPKLVARRILKATNKALTKDGAFFTFQYSMVKKNLLEQYFKIRGVNRIIRNLPPAYVLELYSKKIAV